jgi:hypothetical protein
LGDLNAKIGRENVIATVAWKYTLHEVTSENGKRSEQLAARNNIIIKSTCFEHKVIHKGTWMCPRTDVVNQIDHVIIDKRHASSIMGMQSRCGPNCDSDRFLVKVTLRERLPNALKNQGRKRRRWNTDKLKNKDHLNLYQQKINEKLEDIDEIQDIQTEWNKIKNVIVEAATESLGEKKAKRNEECRAAIQEKNTMRIVILQRMTRNNKENYREYRKRAKKICWEKKREMLRRQIESIEVDMERADTKKYYQSVNCFRKGFQPRINACKDNSGKLIEGGEKILEHWAKYFTTQFEKENSEEESDEEVFLTAEPLVIEPSQEEMEKAICNLKTNKAPGENDITAELIKNASYELKERLHVLICKICRDKKLPDDWKVGLIVPLFKKGDKMRCENYQGITLLNVAYKILSSIILEWLKEYSEEISREYQSVSDHEEEQ